MKYDRLVFAQQFSLCIDISRYQDLLDPFGEVPDCGVLGLGIGKTRGW